MESYGRRTVEKFAKYETRVNFSSNFMFFPYNYLRIFFLKIEFFYRLDIKYSAGLASTVNDGKASPVTLLQSLKEKTEEIEKQNQTIEELKVRVNIRILFSVAYYRPLIDSPTLG